MRHKADTYDDIMDAKNTFDMNAVGKIVGMGEYKLFEYLRNKGILFYNSNNDNVPYERFMKAKYFSVIDTIAP
ncbi:MAG: phage antirepressor KilAC domain-containing protein, partial [Methanomethylophilus sp.]